MGEKNYIKRQYVKNMLNLNFLLKYTEEGSGVIFYTNPFLPERRLWGQINKKSTILYLTCYNLVDLLNLNPKFPNFYFVFKSLGEITCEMRLNALFIKVGNIFCCSQILSFSFLNVNILSLFFYFILSFSKISLFFNFFILFKMIYSKIFEFN